MAAADELLLGLSHDSRPEGRYHAVVNGLAACSAFVPIPGTRQRYASAVPVEQRCQRAACRRRWSKVAARPASPAAGDVEHVCPTCLCERDRDETPCPSCGSAYAAEPATRAAAA